MTRPVHILKLVKVERLHAETGRPCSHFERQLDTVGTFHQFGVDFKETNNGVGNFSTAIVEVDETGEVLNIPVKMIEFIDHVIPK